MTRSRSVRRLISLGLLACLGLVATLPVYADEARQLWHQGIASGYSELANQSAGLAEAAQSFCEAPGEANHSQLVDQWKNAFFAWQRVRFVDFGPIEQSSLAWQFQFWPDSKNLVASKVSYWLNRDGALTAESVRSAGVAVQGFPAMEYLLTEPSFQQSERALPSPRSCDFLIAISRHTATNARVLATQWQALEGHFESTVSYNATTIKAAMNALELIRDRRLGAPMGLRGNGRRNPYQADAWRSGTSLATIQASLEGLQSLFLPGLAAELDAAGAGDLKRRFNDQFRETLGSFDQLPEGMATLLSGPGYSRLQSLYIDLEQLEQQLTGGIAPRLGVVRGFNASDGD